MKFIQIDESKSTIVFDLLKKASEWLRDKNIDYWQNWHDPPESHKNWILDGLIKKQFHLMYQGNTLIGMFRLQYDDEMFWGKREDKAGYLHSFTIKREMGGRGLGYKVLTQIETYLKQNGYHYLRLDCGLHNKRLCDYYKNYGFNEVGSITVGGEELVLLEKSL